MFIALLQCLNPPCKDQYTKTRIENFATSLLNEDDESIIDHKLLKLHCLKLPSKGWCKTLPKCVGFQSTREHDKQDDNIMCNWNARSWSCIHVHLQNIFVAPYSNMEVIPYVDNESSKISKVIKMPSSSSNQHQQSQCPQNFNMTCHEFFPPISVNIEYFWEPKSNMEASPNMFHPTYCHLDPSSSALESRGVPFDGSPKYGKYDSYGAM